MLYCAVHSPLGILYIGENGQGEICYLSTKLPKVGTPASTKALQHAEDELERYFAGGLTKFTMELAPEGTPFQLAVWAALCTVPYGITVTYGELAQRAGYPAASRAVGTAMGQNPIAIVQPCHRVLPASGKLGNYSMGGPANKEWLLLLEQQNSKY